MGDDKRADSLPGGNDNRVNDPLVLPVFRVGRDMSAWPFMKLARARSHLGTLDAAIAMWLTSHPYDMDVAIAEDRLSAEWRLRLKTKPPTSEWSLYLGDCVHQLRSALDACVWEFATYDGRQPQRPHLVQFPIRQESDSFADDIANRLGSIPPEIIERIRIVQPFNRPIEERDRDGLVLLQELSNTDKHRSSVQASADPSEIAFEFSVKYHDDEAAGRNVPPNMKVFFPPFEDGALLIRLLTRDRIERLEGEGQLMVRINIDTRLGSQPLFKCISGLITYVQQVLAVVYAGATKGPTTELKEGGEEEGEEDDSEWTSFQPRVDGQ